MVRQESLAVAGVRTHLRRAGSGKPVILLHGLGASSYSWRYALPALSRRFEVFAPDLPGFGRSDKPMEFDYSLDSLQRWFVAFMDAIEVRQARLIGNSLGGVISLWTAIEAPERVERLALLGTPAYPECRPKLLWPLSWPVIGALYEWALGEAAVRCIARSTFVDQSKITPELIAEYSEPLKSAAGRRAVAEFIRGAARLDWNARAGRLREIKHPALVMVGDRDGMVSRQSGERLARELANARFVFVERCGHAPQEDAPERVVPLIEEFLS